MTSYFRVPPMLDHGSGPDKDGQLAELGIPEQVTRNLTYTPDGNRVIAVENAEDADHFRREAGWIEIVGSDELPSPPASQERASADEASAKSASKEKGR